MKSGYLYNYSSGAFIKVDAGFLIVKTFTRLYDEYKIRYDLRRDIYAIPRIDREPVLSPVQYRGLDRDALDDNADSEMDAEVYLAVQAIDNRVMDGIVFARDDAESAIALLGVLQTDYEIIWSRIAGGAAVPPDGYSSAGFEPTYFVSDHFSASCDCMLFPRWHGTDEEGVLFMPYIRQLNKQGLFASTEVAQEFLEITCRSSGQNVVSL